MVPIAVTNNNMTSSDPTTSSPNPPCASTALPYQFIPRRELSQKGNSTLITSSSSSTTTTSNNSSNGVEVSAVALPMTDNARPTYFVCGRNTGIVSLYGISQEEGFAQTHQIRFPHAVNDVSFSADGLRTCVALEDGSVRIVDTGTMREVGSMRAPVEEGSATCAVYAPQSNLLAVGTYGGGVYTYDARPPRDLVRKLSHGVHPVSSVAFHPDGTVLLSTGMDSLARVWDSAGPCLATLIGSSDRGLGSGVFSPNGRYALLGAMDDGALGLWDLAHSGRLKRVRKYARTNSQYWMRAAFTDQGSIVAGSEDGKLRAWDASSALLLAELDTTSAPGGITVPLACAASKSCVVYGGIGSPNPVLVDLIALNQSERPTER